MVIQPKFPIEQSLSQEIQNFTVDTSFLDFLSNNHNISNYNSLPANTEQLVKEKINADFEQLRVLGNKICSKTHDDIEQVLKNERQIDKNMRKNLLVKLKEFLIFYKSLGIPAAQIMNFPVTPYYHPKAQAFIESSKFGRTERLKMFIEKENNETFVYEYDHLLLTSLHWAVKRNHTRTAEFLIQANSFVNALDIFGRPPLYYAILNKNTYLCYHLLMRNANPWSCKGADYLEMAKNAPEVFNLIKKFRRADIYITLVNYKQRDACRKRLFGKIQEPKLPMN